MNPCYSSALYGSEADAGLSGLNHMQIPLGFSYNLKVLFKLQSAFSTINNVRKTKKTTQWHWLGSSSDHISNGIPGFIPLFPKIHLRKTNQFVHCFHDYPNPSCLISTLGLQITWHLIELVLGLKEHHKQWQTPLLLRFDSSDPPLITSPQKHTLYFKITRQHLYTMTKQEMLNYLPLSLPCCKVWRLLATSPMRTLRFRQGTLIATAWSGTIPQLKIQTVLRLGGHLEKLRGEILLKVNKGATSKSNCSSQFHLRLWRNGCQRKTRVAGEHQVQQKQRTVLFNEPLAVDIDKTWNPS